MPEKNEEEIDLKEIEKELSLPSKEWVKKMLS